jgi:DNA-binding protein H-NS
MTATYSELMAQAQALMAQAEAARKAELSTVIADIKTKMREMGITVDDLGDGKSISSGKS